MLDRWPYLVVFVAIVVVIAAAIAAVRQAKREKQRLAELAARCARRRWTFRREKMPADMGVHQDLREFTTGYSRIAFNNITGSAVAWGRELPMVAGDFQYKSDHGQGEDRRTMTTTFSYLMVRLPVPTPLVTIRRENVFDRVAGAVGFEDLDFESAEFSRRFHVSGSERKFVYDLIDARMMELLLGRERDLPALTLVAGRLYLVGKSTWPAEKFEAMAAFASDWLEHWPAHVRASLRVG